MTTPNDVVGSAITILGKGLDAHITKVMAPIIGQLEWPLVLKEIDAGKGKIGYIYSRHDVAMQLRMITERLGGIGYPFDEGDYNRTLSSYGGILRIFRKRWAHNDEFSHFEANHLLDTVRIVMTHIGDHARAVEIASLHTGLVGELASSSPMSEDVDQVTETEALAAVEPRLQQERVTTCQSPIYLDTEPEKPTRVLGLDGFRSTTYESLWEPWDISVIGVQEDLDRLRTKQAQQNTRAVIEVIVDTEAPVHADRLAKLVGCLWPEKSAERSSQSYLASDIAL